jgi:hypothetical protein
MAKLDRGDMYEPKKVGTKLNSIIEGLADEDETAVQVRRVAVEAFRFAKATLEDASSAEQDVALTPTDGLGAIPAGTPIIAIQTANTLHPFLLSTAYRPATMAVNTINLLTTNFAGQVAGVILANRADL